MFNIRHEINQERIIKSDLEAANLPKAAGRIQRKQKYPGNNLKIVMIQIMDLDYI